MTGPRSSSSRTTASLTGEESRAYTIQALPPQAFDKYTLIGKLGHGGMAEVLLAVMGGKGGFRKLTVLKRLHPHLEGESGFVDMFLDEARLAAQLDHPNCVQTLEVGECGEHHFLAMEYLDGQGLERLLRSSAQTGQLLPVPIAVRIIADALDGLGYAHELTGFDGTPLGVVHRDVSPQNLFVTYTGVVKLLDFGIAKAETNVVQTRTGVIKGKYAYIAPEQALAQTVDHRADLWSMAVVLWECLTSRRLFKSVNELATLQETLTGTIKRPSEFNPAVPPELDAIVMRALQRDPDQRFQTAAEFRTELERWLGTQPNPPSRRTIATLMNERFEEVQVLHKEKLQACLAALEVGQSSIQKLVDADRASSSRFASLTPSYTGASPLTGAGPLPPPPAVPSGAAPAPAEERDRALAWKLVALALLVLLLVFAMIVWPRMQGTNGLELAGTGGDTAPTTQAPAVAEAVVAEPGPSAPSPAEPAVADPAPSAPEDAVAASPDPAPSEPVAVRPSSSSASSGTSGRGGRRGTRSEASGNAEAAPAPAASTSQEDAGFLSLSTSPWTQVTLSGRDLGTTPLMRVRLPAGRHVLRLVNAEAGISEQYEVEIRPGETTTRRLGLR